MIIIYFLSSLHRTFSFGLPGPLKTRLGPRFENSWLKLKYKKSFSTVQFKTHHLRWFLVAKQSMHIISVVKRQHFTNIDHIMHYSKIMALLN